MTLTGKQKRHLRALGHHLSPVVMIGHQGLTDAVVEHTNAALDVHELVKVKTLADDVTAELAEKTGAAIVQELGHTALLYRRRKKDPVIVLPPRG
ncbi:MAG: YhbY family RNA-binding protein [Myxococcota bacterium]